MRSGFCRSMRHGRCRFVEKRVEMVSVAEEGLWVCFFAGSPLAVVFLWMPEIGQVLVDAISSVEGLRGEGTQISCWFGHGGDFYYSVELFSLFDVNVLPSLCASGSGQSFSFCFHFCLCNRFIWFI